jgi:hypothetical protein
MDHRCETRRSIDARVVIDCRPAGLMHGRIQNISTGGIYIKMRPMRGLANDNVKVVLLRRQGSVCRIYRVPAVVIRWGRDGAGLMFSDLTPNAFYTLLAILLADEHRKTGAAYTAAAGKKGAAPGKPRGSWSNKYDA